jgi:hypothetical protein
LTGRSPQPHVVHPSNGTATEIFDLATTKGLLLVLQNRVARVRMSFYAEDVAFYMNPDKEEMGVTNDILELFGAVSGLVTNKDKSAIYPI